MTSTSQGPRRRRSAGLTAGLMSVALVAAGCGGAAGDDGPVNLTYTFWGNTDRGDLTTEAIAIFEEKNPDITVDITFADFESYWQKLATEAAGGNPPDVVQMDYTYLREYADRGVLLDLAPLVGEQIDTDDLVGGLSEAGRVDDGYYAIPIGSNMMSFQYDAAVWDAAGAVRPETGWTWDDYAAAAAAVTEANGGDPWGGMDIGEHLHMLDVWLRQNGGQVYTDSGELGFTEADLIEFWELNERWRDAESVIPLSAVDQAIADTSLAVGATASEFAWDNFLPSTENTYGSELALAPFPSDTDELGLYAKPSMLMSVTTRTDHPEESARLIDFMINDPDAGRIFGANRGLPATTTQRETAEFEGVNARIEEYENSMEGLLGETPAPPPPGGAGVERLMQRLNEEVAYDRATVADTAARFMTEAEQILADAA
ncbi:ABC-type sugar transport system, periplasmic component [Actinoalloteichus sp. GBA129-24]|uniref:ABC-type sugar transport system, periplasmic component n=2 Tax=Pseudonocardiaceae TaxID=2070 RepID=A0AAC9LGV9_9PSEU|nr:ABC-type sugar transport system, periplasmic component [Actinoalloteichus fjordicus]APU22213.1 ABC-type sugar transport system, periplasmic component [Actinoalloteichus sp. GBA129-24]